MEILFDVSSFIRTSPFAEESGDSFRHQESTAKEVQEYFKQGGSSFSISTYLYEPAY